MADTEAEIVVLDSQKKDFSDEYVNEAKAAKEIVDRGLIHDAINRLLALEKRARLAGDTKTTLNCALLIIRILYEQKEWNMIGTYVTLLSKRRGQFKQVQQSIVQEALPYVTVSTAESGMSNDQKLSLIGSLRTVSEGKIFLEVERARLTSLLSKMKEEAGDIVAAAEILQEEQVETYGAMDKREKFNYLLEQLRLCLLKRDFIRTLIIAKKMTKKMLDDPDLEDLKIQYLRYLMIYYTYEKNIYELAQCALQIYRCKLIKESESKWIPELQQAIILISCSPYDNEQIDVVHKLLQFDMDKLKKIPAYKALLEHLTGKEISPWPLPEHNQLSFHPLFKNTTESMDVDNDKAFKNPSNELPPLPDSPSSGIDWIKILRERIVEHSIRVVSGYYTKITLKRLSGFLQLSADETELTLSRMITSSKIPLIAKIDRPSGIVTFSPKRNANDHLDEWTSNIGELLGLVEKTCHQIHKETMLHSLKDQQAANNES